MPNIAVDKANGNSVQFRISLYHDEREIRLNFPEQWDLVECRMAGHDSAPLSADEIQWAFENPIGSPRIREMARGKEKVAILFDDMDRPTPAYQLIPYVLKELAQGGIGEDKIRFVCAPGCHAPLTREEMTQKLGRDTVENYSVFNHNVYEHLVKMGTTSQGTPVIINREVASCDLKIGIGCLIPHFSAGYGGGAKILLPGVSSLETVAANHVNMKKLRPERVGIGKIRDNPVRLDMEEAARIAGLDCVVDVVLNHKKEILGAFVGDLVEEHRKGVQLAAKIYGTEHPGKCDLVVLNTFPIETAPKKVLSWAGADYLNDGGDVVLIWQSVIGMHPHFLNGAWGSDYGGKQWEKHGGPFRIPNAKRLLIYTETMSKEEQKWWGHSDKIFRYREWGALIEALKQDHGKGTRAAVYPYATLQCPLLPDEDL